MISSLQTRNFKGLHNVALSDLGRVNVIVGPNGSGKTTLLRAILLYASDPNLRSIIEAIDADNQTVTEWIRRAPTLLSVASGNGRNGHSFTVSGVAAKRTRSVEIAISRRAGEVTLTDPELSGADPREHLKFVRATADLVFEVVVKERGIRRKKPHTFFLSVRHGMASDQTDADALKNVAFVSDVDASISALPTLWSRLADARLTEGVVALLRRLEPLLEDIHLGVADGNTPVLRVRHKVLGTVPPSAIGSGFVNAINDATALAHPTVKYVLIDEFDRALHVANIRKLVEFAIGAARDTGKQLFVTTHRADALEAFLDRIREGETDIRFVQLRRDKSGELSARVFDAKLALLHADELGLDLRWPP